jgi:hypothetical protein
MKRFLLVFAIVMSLSMGLLLVACGDHDEWRHKDFLTQQSGDGDDNNAKDRSAEELNCDMYDIIIEDCFDACSCCYYGQEANTQLCLTYCDRLVNKVNTADYEPTKADYTLFKECTLGCVSLCDGREKEDICWDECKKYLGL